MKPITAKRWYQANEFATLTGVTVRALHHYDRLGLLQPSGRTAAGYRLYGERDFARLEQIVALKFIGFSLKQIRDILSRNALDLAMMLRLQRDIIAEKRHRLDLAICAIERAESIMTTGDEPDWEAFREIIEVIIMQNDMSWTEKYYSAEAQEKLAERRRTISPEFVKQAERDWATLIKEVETTIAAGEDPASEHGQSLAARWSELIKGFTGGDPAIAEGLGKLYADQANWPSTFQKPFSDEAQAFIARAAAARKQNASQ